MRILGLMMVRNGEDRVKYALDSMALCCDAICVLDDRSVDRTPEILRTHPAVTNTFTADSAISQEDWFFPESRCLDLLYRMADFYVPDWIVAVDHDQIIEPAREVRQILSSVEANFSVVKTSCVSVWRDQRYPLMVPLLSPAKSLQGRIWRYYPGLTAGSKPLHNGHSPSNISNFGDTKTIDTITFYHYGWDTLQKRIDKVNFYTSLDPTYEYNFNVPYDCSLLFGYKRHAIDELIRGYRTKFDEYKRLDKPFVSSHL